MTPREKAYTVTKDTVLPLALVFVLLGGAWQASAQMQKTADTLDALTQQLKKTTEANNTDHERIMQQMTVHEALTLHKPEFAHWADVAEERLIYHLPGLDLPDPPKSN